MNYLERIIEFSKNCVICHTHLRHITQFLSETTRYALSDRLSIFCTAAYVNKATETGAMS